MPELCKWCFNPFTAESLASMAYGVFTLPCGCRMHRGCLQHVLKCNLTCQCEPVEKELIRRDQEGVPVDFGDSSLFQTKALCHLMARANIAAEENILGEKLTPKPVVPAMPSPTKPIATPKKGKVEMKKANAKVLLANQVGIEELNKEGIGMTDLRQNDITIDKLAITYGLGIEKYIKYLQPNNKWGQLVDMGLKWTHLKNKVLFNPTYIAMYVQPSTDQFLSIFVDPEELKRGYEPISDVSGVERHLEVTEKEQKRAMPFRRLMELNYTSIELTVFGVTADHLINVLGAPLEEVKQLYNSTESGARLVIGPPPADCDRFGKVIY